MANIPALGHGISLRQTLSDAEFVGADDVRALSCCCDHRWCRPGDLFVVFDETLLDAVADAQARGASAILSSRPLSGCRLPICYVADVREAYGRVCQALAGDPSARMRLVGIAGGEDKTTAAQLTASVLSLAGCTTGALGSLGYSDSLDFEPARWTTPPAPVTADWLARMAAAGCTHGVLEVSDKGLHEGRLAGVAFDVIATTGGRGRSQLSGRLLDHLAPEGFTIVNADDVSTRHNLARVDGPVLTYGLERPAELTATVLESFLSEQTFLLTVGQESTPVRTRLVTRRNIYNCLLAASVGVAYGIDLPTIVRGLELVSCVPGQLERLDCGQPFTVFVDEARSPTAIAETLAALRPLVNGRLIVVCGPREDEDRAARTAIGRALHADADLSVITSDRRDQPLSKPAGADVLEGFRADDAVHVVSHREFALRWALGEAKPNDVVLALGRHRESGVIDEDTPPHDRDTLRDHLYEMFAPGPMFRIA